MAYGPHNDPAMSGNPLTLDAVSVYGINQRLDSVTQLLMAQREDLVHTRSEVDLTKSLLEKVSERLGKHEEHIDSLRMHRVSSEASWNGPKKTLAVIGSIAALVTVLGGVANLLVAFGGLG